ncbi:MAG: hypothetical protein AAGC70_07095, partial [Pseudomonadota bacterium]
DHNGDDDDHNGRSHVDRHDDCVSRRVIRRRLVSAGWHEFNHVVFKRNIVRFRATNYDGERYLVFLNRCSGRIVDTLRLDSYPKRKRHAKRRHYRYKHDLY